MKARSSQSIPWCPPPREAPAAPTWSPRILDLRGEQVDPPRARDGAAIASVRRGRVVVRQPSDVDGVCLHQTAVSYGGHGDARYRRALQVATHALAFRDGVGVLSAPPSWWMSGGGALNRQVVHLEVEGLYSGLLDDPTTAPREDLETTWQGREPDDLTETTIETARATLRALVEATREWGANVRYLYAHRQSSATRRSDPGEGLWRALVPWAERELGLVPRPDFTVGDGRPIPSAWDERGIGRY